MSIPLAELETKSQQEYEYYSREFELLMDETVQEYKHYNWELVSQPEMREKLRILLEKANITLAFKTHISKTYERILANPKLRPAGINYLIQICDIDTDVRTFGVFSPSGAQLVEEEAIFYNANNSESAFTVGQLDLNEWIDNYNSEYGTNLSLDEILATPTTGKKTGYSNPTAL